MGAGPGLVIGDRVEVQIGSIAHGGHCVARHDGQVLFVRHALPGETAVVRVSEIGPGGRFARADAVEVVRAAPERVSPPCPYAGACGGCDFQHVALPAQRELKAAVVREQFARLAHLDVDVTVQPLPGDVDGLRWRTRAEFAVSGEQVVGMRRHRSHDVLDVADCLISSVDVVGTGVLQRDPHTIPEDVAAFDVTAPSIGDPVVTPLPRHGPPNPVGTVTERITTASFAHDFTVSAHGFWQVHPGAAATFVEQVLTQLAPRPGERALDLYAGAGLFAAGLAAAVGPGGQVIAVESDAEAAGHAEANLGPWPHAAVAAERVDHFLGAPRVAKRRPGRRPTRERAPRASALAPPTADLVVLDPPRTGAGRHVVLAIARLRPRAIAYVACDPAPLARDTATLGEAGYALTGLTAYDAFPMTHHVECIAVFGPARDGESDAGTGDDRHAQQN